MPRLLRLLVLPQPKQPEPGDRPGRIRMVVSVVCPPRQELERLEAEAKAAKRGLWVDKDPLPPWEFRRLR